MAVFTQHQGYDIEFIGPDNIRVLKKTGPEQWLEYRCRAGRWNEEPPAEVLGQIRECVHMWLGD